MFYRKRGYEMSDNMPPGYASDLYHMEQQQAAFERAEEKAYECAIDEIGGALDLETISDDDIEVTFIDYDKDGDFIFDAVYKPTGYTIRLTIGNPMYPDFYD